MKSFFLSLLFIFLSLGQAFGLEVPTLTGPVVDQAGLYSSQEIETLSQLSAQMLQKGGPQFQILVVDTLDGEPIESYSIKVTDQWKLGDTKKDNGLLLLIAKKDRKMRIEVGQGLEGDITDFESSVYIEKILKPAFKQQQYFEGTAVVILKVAEKLNIQLDHKQNTSFQSSRGKRKGISSHLIILVIIIIIFFFMNGSGGSRFGRSSYYGGGLYGGGYHSRSSSSSGVSWGGGGGGFSGGGASGDW